MEPIHTKGEYDFRQYDRVWQRVVPALSPWGSEQTDSGGTADPADNAEDAAPDNAGLSVRAAELPGADPDPCCMGTEAASDLEVLAGFGDEERSEQRHLLAMEQRAPVWARQCLRRLAGECAARARRLRAVRFLIAGEAGEPLPDTDRIYIGRWRPALRERYHAAACTAMNYARAAEGTPDPCLAKLLNELSVSAYRSASDILRLLERSFPS